MLQIFEQAKQQGGKIAIQSNGQSYTYTALLNSSRYLASKLLQQEQDLQQTRVAFMVHPGFDYVRTMWAIWQAGGVAVPLCLTYPLPSLQYVLEDTGASHMVVSKEFSELLNEYAQQHKIKFYVLEDLKNTNELLSELPLIQKDRNALILYTSGTTNLPKGVVTTHANIEAQISTLVKSWEWTSQDHTICVLPLHHVHGIINVVGCSMWIGATCTFIQSFSANEIFRLFEQGDINVFMAVPTIYFKLISYLETLDVDKQAELKKGMQAFRLMVCGSAALPVSVMEKWEKMSGHTLLERYGMTELGMAISNPYHGARKAGYVGIPLPSVEVKLVDEQYQEVEKGSPGEIIVKGPNVFKEYWKKPTATEETFTSDGWFKTGDIAIVEEGYYRIMGRSSVDIIKSGGYKISALEIEEVLRTHQWIEDCAVVGIADDEWGELIVAALVLNEQAASSFESTALNDWLVQQMAGYKKPRKYIVVSELPRNAMGKVVKNEVKKIFNQ
jgi:malonyl-CoA/methylmalonyl-CoA synthetase